MITLHHFIGIGTMIHYDKPFLNSALWLTSNTRYHCLRIMLMQTGSSTLCQKRAWWPDWWLSWVGVWWRALAPKPTSQPREHVVLRRRTQLQRKLREPKHEMHRPLLGQVQSRWPVVCLKDLPKRNRCVRPRSIVGSASGANCGWMMFWLASTMSCRKSAGRALLHLAMMSKTWRLTWSELPFSLDWRGSSSCRLRRPARPIASGQHWGQLCRSMPCGIWSRRGFFRGKREGIGWASSKCCYEFGFDSDLD